MLVMKLLLELSVLLALFLLIRKALFKAFPLKAGQPGEITAKLRGQKALFSVVFIAVGIIASVTTFWLTYFSFNVLHSLGHYSGVLVIRQVALVMPSLIIGFYISTVFAKHIYVSLFGFNELISFDETYGERKGVGRTFGRIFAFCTLLPAFVLLALQFNVYLKTDGQRIYSKEMLGDEKVYSVKEIVSVGAHGSRYLDIYLADGEKISTTGYSGNFNYFLDNISQH